MNREDTRRLLAFLAGAYPASKIRAETVDAYAVCLADLATQEVQQATIGLIQTSRFLPTIAEIRARITQTKLAAPLPDEAYANAQHAAEHPEARHELHPLTYQAVGDVGGWWPIRRGDNASVLRGQFVRAYKARLERHADDVSTGQAQPLTAPDPFDALPSGDPE